MAKEGACIGRVHSTDVTSSERQFLVYDSFISSTQAVAHAPRCTFTQLASRSLLHALTPTISIQVWARCPYIMNTGPREASGTARWSSQSNSPSLPSGLGCLSRVILTESDDFMHTDVKTLDGRPRSRTSIPAPGGLITNSRALHGI